MTKSKPKPLGPDPPKKRDTKCRIIDLGTKRCRWPLEDGWYCGAPATRGAYCDEHGAISYRPNDKYRR